MIKLSEEFLVCILLNNRIFLSWQEHIASIKAIYTGSEFLENVAAGYEVGLVLESTSFYAEQGGQVSYCLDCTVDFLVDCTFFFLFQYFNLFRINYEFLFNER